MSKDFEQAYRELAQNEAPDLWDRIEAGIACRSIPENIENSQDSGRGSAQGSKNNKSKEETGSFRIFAKKYSGVAAAVLCAAVILPVAVLVRNLGSQSYSGGAKSEETAPDTAQTEVSEEGAENMAAESMADKAAAGAAYANPADSAETGQAEAEMSEAEMEESMDTGASGFLSGGADGAQEDRAASIEADSAAGTGMPEETGADKGMERQQLTESNTPKDSAEKKEKAENVDLREESGAAPELSDGAVLKNVVVKVTGAGDGIEEESENGLFGTVYTAVVREDASGTLKEGSRIEIFVPVYSSFMLIQDQMFQMDIVYEGDAAYPFVLEGNAVQIEEGENE